MRKEKKPWSKKKKIIVGCIIAFLAIGIIGGVAGSDEQPVQDKVAAETAESKKEDTKKEVKEEIKEPEKKDLTIGDTAEIKDYKITVNAVNVKDMSQDSYFQSSKPDTDILLVDATVENTGDKDLTLSSMLMLKVVDKDGRELTMTVFGDNNGVLDGTIAAGRKITGEYAVEFPRGASPADYELEFKPLGNKAVYFKLA